MTPTVDDLYNEIVKPAVSAPPRGGTRRLTSKPTVDQLYEEIVRPTLQTVAPPPPDIGTSLTSPNVLMDAARQSAQQAGGAFSRFGELSKERMQESGQHLIDVARGLLPGGTLPGATWPQKTLGILGAAATPLTVPFNIGGAAVQTGVEGLGTSPGRSRTIADVAEMVAGLVLPFVPTGTSVLAKAGQRVGMGRAPASVRQADMAARVEQSLRKTPPPRPPMSPLEVEETARTTAHEFRGQAIDQALTEAERLRQSPKGAELLTDQLRGQATSRVPPLSTLQLPPGPPQPKSFPLPSPPQLALPPATPARPMPGQRAPRGALPPAPTVIPVTPEGQGIVQPPSWTLGLSSKEIAKAQRRLAAPPTQSSPGPVAAPPIQVSPTILETPTPVGMPTSPTSAPQVLAPPPAKMPKRGTPAPTFPGTTYAEREADAASTLGMSQAELRTEVRKAMGQGAKTGDEALAVIAERRVLQKAEPTPAAHTLLEAREAQIERLAKERFASVKNNDVLIDEGGDAWVIEKSTGKSGRTRVWKIPLDEAGNKLNHIVPLEWNDFVMGRLKAEPMSARQALETLKSSQQAKAPTRVTPAPIVPQATPPTIATLKSHTQVVDPATTAAAPFTPTFGTDKIGKILSARWREADALASGKVQPRDYLKEMGVKPADESMRNLHNSLIHLENRGGDPNLIVKDFKPLAPGHPLAKRGDSGLYGFSQAARQDLGLPLVNDAATQVKAADAWIARGKQQVGNDPRAIMTWWLNQDRTRKAYAMQPPPKVGTPPVAATGTPPSAPSQPPLAASGPAEVSIGTASNWVAPESAGQAVGTVEVGMGLRIPKEIREGIGRALVPNYQLHETYVAAKRERAGEFALSRERTAQIGKSLNKGKTLQQQHEVGGALQGRLPLANPAEQAKVDAVRSIIDNLSRQYNTEGILPPSITDPNIGMYTRRVYLRDILGDRWSDTVRSKHPTVVQEAKDYLSRTQMAKVDPSTGKVSYVSVNYRGPNTRPLAPAELDDIVQRILQPKAGGGVTLFEKKPIRIDQSTMKARQDIPPEIRRLMGEVENGGYLAARTIADMNATLINKRFFDKIATGSETINGQVTPWFRPTPAPGYSKFPLPDTPSLGAAKNQYVLERYWPEIQDILKTRNQVERFYDRSMSLWKAGKVIWNPKTWGNNILGNTVFSDFAGTPIHDPRKWGFYKQAARELWTKSPLRERAIKVGAVGSEYATAELSQMAEAFAGAEGNAMDAIFNVAEKVNGPLGRFYNAQDQVFKMATFLDQLSQGKTDLQAAAHVNRWYPNYAEVGRGVKYLRRSPLGAPFLSFTAEAARIYVSAIAQHPIKFAKWVAVFPATLTAYSAAKQGLSFDDLKQMYQDLPERLQRKYLALLPMRDSNGNLRVWDLSYILPMADTFEARGVPFIGNVALSNPMVNTVIQVARDENFMTGQKITEPGTSRLESAGKFVAQQALPSLTPGIGYGAQRIESAIREQPRQWPYTNVETIPEAVTGALTPFGTIPLDVGLDARKATERIRAVRDIEEQVRRVVSNKSLTAEQRDERLQYLYRQADELRKSLSQ